MHSKCSFSNFLLWKASYLMYFSQKFENSHPLWDPVLSPLVTRYEGEGHRTVFAYWFLGFVWKKVWAWNKVNHVTPHNRLLLRSKVKADGHICASFIHHSAEWSREMWSSSISVKGQGQMAIFAHFMMFLNARNYGVLPKIQSSWDTA